MRKEANARLNADAYVQARVLELLLIPLLRLPLGRPAHRAIRNFHLFRLASTPFTVCGFKDLVRRLLTCHRTFSSQVNVIVVVGHEKLNVEMQRMFGSKLSVIKLPKSGGLSHHNLRRFIPLSHTK